MDTNQNLLDIAKKWQEKWEEAKLFETNPDSREKFFAVFPYPYINAYQHIGHMFTLMRVEALARYKRLQGFNVLFPQGWHATGSPIVNAAKRVKAKEEKQISIMKGMGFSDTEIAKFEQPEYWIEFFAPEFEKDYRSLGMSVDWRRQFHTTSLNPHYDKFIQWQFRKLKEGNYVIKGKFPVVWDPVENTAVGDHARVEGEGVIPQEFLLVKHKLNDGRFVVSATLRPDTILGITNLYVHPKLEYVEAKVNGEQWILSEVSAKRLQEQDYSVEITGKVNGIDLIGQKTEEIDGHSVLILPATFLDPNFGTGLVHSVPSDSADDLIALYDFQKDEKKIAEYGLDVAEVQAIKPIGVLDTPGYGDIPAQKMLDNYGIKHQNERGKLDKIRDELYKLSFYTATYNNKYKDFFSEDFSGKKVDQGKDKIKNEIIERGWGAVYYQLTGKVVSRTLTECIVKIVDDQWFMDYNNPEWKQLTHKCLDQMNLYPEKSRQQFDYVIDWLHEWACTREEGLGTKLPWDEKWLIESLSDSTIYMAYYTIVHLLEKVPLEFVDDALFDYILLGKGQKPNVEAVDEMRESFDYYYPVDFNNSGKDLIQNHLTFFMFNHVAIFPEDKWPKGIGANGWVTVDGQKMSKSLGNMIPVRDIAGKYGPDVARMTILNGGEEMDDPNWDSKFADSMTSKLLNLKEFSEKYYQDDNLRTEQKQIDLWFSSELHKTIKAATEAMEKTLFRTAIQKVYFEMQRIVKHYINRTGGDVHKDLMTEFVETQLLLLSPFVPHICEEIWSCLGKEGFISEASWPVCDESKIDESLSIGEAYVSQIISDLRNVMQLAKLEKLSSIQLFISETWKYTLYDTVKTEVDNGNRDFKAILGKIMATDLKSQGKNITKLLPVLLKKGMPNYVAREQEIKILEESLSVIESEFGCSVTFTLAEESNEAKAKSASPGKPSILVS